MQQRRAAYIQRLRLNGIGKPVTFWEYVGLLHAWRDQTDHTATAAQHYPFTFQLRMDSTRERHLGDASVLSEF